MIVAVAIISLLSSVVLASLSGARASARDAKRQQDMRQIEQALQQYKTRFGEYPAAGGGSGRCKHPSNKMRPELQPLVNEGVLSSIPCDPQIDGDDSFQYHYFSPGKYAWWGTDNEYCGTKPTNDLAYFLLYTPENTVDEVPFSNDGPVSGNTCGPGSGNSQRCCVHSG
jgi:type II secretory pathway pseudopilin PulG